MSRCLSPCSTCAENSPLRLNKKTIDNAVLCLYNAAELKKPAVHSVLYEHHPPHPLPRMRGSLFYIVSKRTMVTASKSHKCGHRMAVYSFTIANTAAANKSGGAAILPRYAINSKKTAFVLFRFNLGTQRSFPSNSQSHIPHSPRILNTQHPQCVNRDEHA